MDFDASVRAKLGYAFDDNILLYGTGGVAFGDVKTTYRSRRPSRRRRYWSMPAAATACASAARWARGLAYAITPNWSVSGEYRWTDLGEKSFTNNTLGVSDKNEFSYSALRLGITYRFAPPPPAPPMAAPMPAAAPAPRAGDGPHLPRVLRLR